MQPQPHLRERLIVRNAQLRGRAWALEGQELEVTPREDPLEAVCGIDAERALGVVEHAGDRGVSICHFKGASLTIP